MHMIREAIKQAVDKDDRTQKAIAEAAGMHAPNLSDYLNGVTDLRGESLSRLLAALSLKIGKQKKAN
mgnify:CR=1 FL=1